MNTSEDIIANMNNAQHFTKLDLCKGYWQLHMPRLLLETAIIYEFIRMPFGLINSEATLSGGLIKKSTKRNRNTGVHVDDIIIYNDTWQEYLDQ